MLVSRSPGRSRDARDLTKTDARVVAEHWVVGHLPRGARLAADPSTPDLAGLPGLALKLPRPGQPYDPNRDVGRLRDQGVRYVVVTGAVEDRVLAAAASTIRARRGLRQPQTQPRVYPIRPPR